VRVANSMFAGTEGVLESKKGENRLSITVPSINSVLSIDIDAVDLEQIQKCEMALVASRSGNFLVSVAETEIVELL
jgi:hypothetical protein